MPASFYIYVQCHLLAILICVGLHGFTEILLVRDIFNEMNGKALQLNRIVLNGITSNCKFLIQLGTI